MSINYAQCWEDPDILRKVLQVTSGDDVVSIASGGDNTFALLLDNPHSVTAIDHNPAQLHLVELKLRAIEQLEYDEFVAFVAARDCLYREWLYLKIRPALSTEAQAYWDSQSRTIRDGIIHCGKFENYFAAFNRFVLPLIHRKRTVTRFLTVSTLEEQNRLYERVWNNRRWRWLFLLFFSKYVLSRLGRSRAFFRYVTLEEIGETLLSRTHRGLTQIPIKKNYFVEYIVTGRYLDLENAHPYLRASNFRILKERVERVRLVCASLDEFLRTAEPGSISKLNLSDVFEYMSEEQVEDTLRQVLRVSRPDTRLAFWTLFVPQTVPASLSGRLHRYRMDAENLRAADRTFFYDRFCAWQVK
jgi:S-adenosylmethionine-diacylglycerol 3-amino-3-carboxypropyl transferase